MSEAKRKAAFWWASVAGAEAEPVEVAELEGERVAYSLGCADPFYLDRDDCPCVLVLNITAKRPTAHSPEELAADKVQAQLKHEQDLRDADAARQAENLRRDGHHHWRGPR